MKQIVLCDLDGTLADGKHRNHLILQKPKKWKEYFDLCEEDEPFWHVIDLINNLCGVYEIWIVSARPDGWKKQTLNWLRKHGVKYDRLVMRSNGDNTDDGVLKPSWLEDGTIPRDRVAFVLDDRDRVVRGWRRAGVPCFQVAEGDF